MRRCQAVLLRCMLGSRPAILLANVRWQRIRPAGRPCPCQNSRRLTGAPIGRESSRKWCIALLAFTLIVVIAGIFVIAGSVAQTVICGDGLQSAGHFSPCHCSRSRYKGLELIPAKSHGRKQSRQRPFLAVKLQPQVMGRFGIHSNPFRQ